jgi:hypothetical protein
MRQVLPLLILLLFSTSPAFAVRPADLITEPDGEFSAAAGLTPSQVSADLHVLRFAVKDAYAGPAQLGLALAKFSSKAKDSAALCQALSSLFSGIRDRHLKAFLDFKICVATTSAGKVGGNLNTTTAPWSMHAAAAGNRPVSVLAISRFAPEDDPDWFGFLGEVARLRQQNQSFVIDLRGNAGGDDDNGFEMARILYGFNRETDLPSPLAYMSYVQSSASFAVQLTGWNYQIAQLLRNGQPVPPYFYQRQAEWRGWFDRSRVTPFPNPHISNIKLTAVDRTTVFTKNVYVLIDRLCASACETTLQALEGLPHRILVGENTMGAVEYGAVGIAVLPHSHIAVQLVTESNHFRDRRRPEKIGYAPQVQVSEGQDALDAALAQIANEP